MIENQRSMFIEELKTLRNDECLLVLDYTRFQESETIKLHDPCFTIYTRGSDGELHHEWMDYFCKAPHDWQFNFEVVQKLKSDINFEQFSNWISFWSDNGLRNYGCHYAKYEFSEQLQIPVGLKFFVSHHGFTIRDTHFGVAKQKFRRDFRGKIIQNPEDIWEIYSQFSNTTMTILTETENREISKSLFNFYQEVTSQFSCFYFVPGEALLCTKDSNSEEWINIEINKQ